MESTINNWKLIKTEEEYINALDKLEFIFDAVPGSAEFDEVELLGLLIKDYEDKHYQIPLPDPIEAVKVKMQELDLHNNDLKLILGSEEHVTAFLNRSEELTLKKAQELHYWLNIPADTFMNVHDNINSNFNSNEDIFSLEKKIIKLKKLSFYLELGH